jgi:hypothetical protein
VRRYVVLAAPLLLVTAIAVWEPAAQPVRSSPGADTFQPAAAMIAAPPLPESLKFAVVGDAGDGGRGQYDVGQQMAAARATFPFDFVIALGDNMYGRQEPQDFVTKFQKPYQRLIDSGVPSTARSATTTGRRTASIPDSTWVASASTPSCGRTSDSWCSTPTSSTRSSLHGPKRR